MQASLPVRERGLKLFINSNKTAIQFVAPRAGAWIETRLIRLIRMLDFVAPRAGAWIETLTDDLPEDPGMASLPVRERGLKRARNAGTPVD
jgi:hypothetical protein